MRSRVGVALTGALVTGCSWAAFAQEVPMTAGGSISASEATPLPPIEVVSPAEPLAKKKTTSQPSGTSGGAGGQSVEATESGAGSGSSADGAPGIFTLGQLDMIGGATVSNDAMLTFNTPSLDQAAALAPGVSMSNLGGRRNERDIFVRGFDRLRVPLSIDGVRVYLPADNRLDMNRFLTPDLAEVQIQKGYVSVLNGPGGMGGAINLVTKKPTKPFEAEARVGATFDGNDPGRNSFTSYGMTGVKQDKYYAQVSGTILDLDHWNLSDDFTPTSFEDGGLRDGSEVRDWRISAKAGYTPNATDEYALTYSTQSGSKGAPLHALGEKLQAQRYWKWPYWDIETVNALSHTQLGAASYIKTNAYYNTFSNLLSSFNDATYAQQTSGFTFNSFYEDFAYGGTIELGTKLIPMNTLKGALHYRLDNHTERNFNRPDHPTLAFLEPWQETEEQTWSGAIENTFHATSRLDIVAGVSKDVNKLEKAEDFNSTLKAPIIYPTGEGEAWNWQSAAIFRYSDDGKAYASVSSRTRFPTIFERFSTRFGTALPNPDLEAERATNYEFGWGDTFGGVFKVSGALFYSEIDDAIQSVLVSQSGKTSFTQSQNVGEGTTRGFEVSADWDILPGLRIGGNYTYLDREIKDPSRPLLQAEGTPMHEALLYLAWSPTASLTITPSLEIASDRWSLATGPIDTGLYVETGAYVLTNLQAEYRVNEIFTLSAGGRNLTDESYELVEGFPEPGRTFYTNARMKF